jgi:surfeit locus 1 family protein
MLFRFLTILFFVAVCAFLVALGFWQLDRAAQKQERFDAYQRASSANVLDWEVIRKNHLTSDDLLWRRVNLFGSYLDNHVLLDNQTTRGRVGYRVFTPFRMTAGTTVLIERGWVPMGRTREEVPVFSTPVSNVSVEGYFGSPPEFGLDLKGSTRSDEELGINIRRVQRIKPKDLESLFSMELMDQIVYLKPGELGALDILRYTPGNGAERHEAYALQWFAMAVILFLIGVLRLRQSVSPE